MKICYVNPTLLIRRPIAELIDNLGDENEIGLFVPRKPFQKVDKSWHSNKSLSKAKIYSYPAVNIPLINFEWPIPISPIFFIHLYRIFKKYKVIHMWTYFYINSWFTLFFKLFFRKRKLILSSDTFPGYSFDPGLVTRIMFKIYTFLFGRIIFSIPNKIHLYGNALIKSAKQAGVSRKKIKVISTGIHLKKFENVIPVRMKSLNLNEKDFVIVYAGLLVPRKGIDIMLKVIENLTRKHKSKNIKLLLIGDGPQKQDYQEMAKRLNIKNNVIFTGWRGDIPNLLKIADVLMLPSRGEGLPGIILEGMASKLPIVASNITSCIPDLVENNYNGYLCKMNSVKEFTKAIEKLYLNKRLRNEMGNNSKIKVKELDWQKLIEQYKEMYLT